ncbi:MAG: glycerol-3-phosphate 1-O-acyltransferase PlsY [Candidatus Tectimicrobiota bacterium]
MWTDLGLCLLAYLLGSISFGLLIARLHGEANLRQRGSGNIGATNVARILGKTAGVLTLLGDGLKGLVAVFMAQAWGQAGLVPALAALGAVLGHMFPVYHGFRGGKGVATALGVLIPTLPLPLLGGLVAWVVVVTVWRYISVASMVAALTIPMLAMLGAYPLPLVLAASSIALLVLYKHRDNLQRLLQGRESKFF